MDIFNTKKIEKLYRQNERLNETIFEHKQRLDMFQKTLLPIYEMTVKPKFKIGSIVYFESNWYGRMFEHKTKVKSYILNMVENKITYIYTLEDSKSWCCGVTEDRIYKKSKLCSKV